jgi:hypothetical protein
MDDYASKLARVIETLSTAGCPVKPKI